MKKLLITILFALLTISCAKPIFFKEIKEINSKMGIGSSFEKKLFKEVEKKIPNSDHILYYLHPFFEKDYTHCTGIIYDYKSKKYFYIEYFGSKIEILESTNDPSLLYQKENINLYLQNKYDEILTKSKKCLISGYNTYDYIYEIDLETGINVNKSIIHFFLCTEFADMKYK